MAWGEPLLCSAPRNAFDHAFPGSCPSLHAPLPPRPYRRCAPLQHPSSVSWDAQSLTGNAEQNALARVFVSPALGLPPEGTGLSLGSAPALPVEHSPGPGTQSLLWTVVTVPRERPSAQSPSPAAPGGQSPSASLGGGGLAEERSSAGEPVALPQRVALVA